MKFPFVSSGILFVFFLAMETVHAENEFDSTTTWTTKTTLSTGKPKKKGLRHDYHDADHGRQERRKSLLDNLEHKDGNVVTRGHDTKNYVEDPQVFFIGIPEMNGDGERSGPNPHTHFNHNHGTQINNNYHTGIVGGQDVDPQQYPYFVDMFGCAGTLIAPRVVLGAAHCGDYEGFAVLVGGPDAETSTVQEQVNHPSYTSSSDENDFMLLLLDEDADVYFDTTVTLSLDQDGLVDNLNMGDLMTIIGLSNTTDTIQEVVLPYLGYGCSAYYGPDFIDTNMFCAGPDDSGSCQDDAGGPIVLIDGDNHILTGVSSWGIGCTAWQFPSVFAKVSSAESWIKETVCDYWDLPASFCSDVGTSGCFDLKMEFQTDDFPEENTSFLYENNEVLVWDELSFSNNTRYEFHEECLDTSKCYTLYFYDIFGDGLFDGGFLRVSVDGQEVYYGTDDILSGVILNIGDGCGR